MPPIYVPKLIKDSNTKQRKYEKCNKEFSKLQINNENIENAVNTESTNDQEKNSNGNVLSGYAQAIFSNNANISDSSFTYKSSPFSMMQHNFNNDYLSHISPIMVSLDHMVDAKNHLLVDPIINLYPNLVPNSCPRCEYNIYPNMPNTLQIQRSPISSNSDMRSYPSPNQMSEPDGNDVTQQALIDKIVASSIYPVINKEIADDIESKIGVNGDYDFINYKNPKYWCTISYYEGGRKFGDLYRSNSKSINIDFHSELVNSDCYGVKNIINLNRSKETEYCRKMIGQGIRLIHSGGEVILESTSKNVPIFVLSQNYNYKNNKPTDNLCMLKYGDSITVFDYHDFAPMLAKCIPYGFEAVYELAKWATIHVSLQKGWGSDYKHQKFNDTPVSFEVKVTGSLSWIDRIVRRLDPPNSICSSMT